ncbi:12931_t:CDS:2 [Dentiscutata heterogama]|uniref:12931_t:CDS:1 n=1 Tax=Dentiscutata heterogama TaxID=1316150 RepID=A0ACA9P1S3_9GLOM|nr:12931_t:CDS:2 [Dentiscutata heterogama]
MENLIPNDSASSISNDSTSSTSNNSTSNIPNDSTSSTPNNSISSISNDSTSCTLNNSISSIPNDSTSSTPNNSTSKDVDNSIVDMVVATGISFNVLNNPFFHRMTKNLHYITYLYKIPHPTTISQHLTGNIFDSRLKFIKDILAKTSEKISLMCNRWYSTIHKCHYTVITGSWMGDNWKIVNIVLSFQKTGQTANEIILAIMNTLKNYSIGKKYLHL